ncbi:GBF-interacting protein 1 [Sesamum alatum]|uniref:GBF-interacting protein 1 n=1 Tax=Sesamum alatum TaxID=300844 RepID=A0AAE2CMJ2_9LAMI|nr:GBF-interacting protein 1 [Sesamum alatum]
MVSGSRIEGGAQVLSAGVRRTIQSIKEIVGNHSDADIYVALKETNMDPNETTQKLLNQDFAFYASLETPVFSSTLNTLHILFRSIAGDPFHEVKRKRDRKKENSGYKNYVAAEPRKNTELAHMPVKYSTYSDRNARRGGPGRNAAPGASREFRVVRDNRVSQNAGADPKPAQSTTSTSEGVTSGGAMKSKSTETSTHQKPPVGQHSSEALNSPADSQPRRTKDATSGGNDRKETLGEKRVQIPSATSRIQTKANSAPSHTANSSTSSVLGVYSSSSDPVHVPSPHSRPAANVGAIRREVGVVGPRRQSSENSAKPSSSQSTSLPNTQSGRDGYSRESTRPFNAALKNDQSNQNMAAESAIPVVPAGRSFSSNQYGSRSHQLMGHQKAPQPNKEWKPKSSVKPIANGPGVIGTPAKPVSPPADNPEDLKKEAAQVQNNMSRLNLSENPNVIIAAHIRVSETDRCRLTFGSLGTELDATMNSICATAEGVDELSTEPSGSVSVSVPESSGDEPTGSKQLEMTDDSGRSSGSNSPDSGAVSDDQLTEKKDSSSQQNLDNYGDVRLVRDSSPSYPPESLQQQDTSELPSLSGYDPQMGYDISYFRPVVDETVRGPGLPSSQEVLGTHTTNAVPASTIAMVQQQQQQQLAQMYPQLHVSHFANLMPYRQFLSPVYVPPMPVPGYSNSPAYPHPSNGSSYLLMPSNSSHLTPSGVKKCWGHDDSSRLKYKDSLYVPNPQAETSEIWMNPRDLPGLQSASYYNMPGQTPHPAYLTSHSGHASFNAAAAAAQSSHMQFPGMYHPPPQPAPIASPHHLGPAIGGNVGVGVAAPAPGAQVGAYQQPQLGHLNWTGNF